MTLILPISNPRDVPIPVQPAYLWLSRKTFLTWLVNMSMLCDSNFWMLKSSQFTQPPLMVVWPHLPSRKLVQAESKERKWGTEGVCVAHNGIHTHLCIITSYLPQGSGSSHTDWATTGAEEKPAWSIWWLRAHLRTLWVINTHRHVKGKRGKRRMRWEKEKTQLNSFLAEKKIWRLGSKLQRSSLVIAGKPPQQLQIVKGLKH